MSQDVSAPPAPSKPARWVYIVLVASLAANLLVVGGAASVFWHHRHGGHGEHGLSGFVSRLHEDRRGPLRAFIEAEREKLKPIRADVRAAWRETNELLGAETFDKEKLKAAMAQMNDAEARMRSAIGDALVETAAKLSPAERRELRAWRERRIERGKHRWRGEREDDEAGRER